MLATIVSSFGEEIVKNEETIQQPLKETQPQKRDIGLSSLSDCDTPSLGLHGLDLGLHSNSYAPSYSSYGSSYLGSGLGKNLQNFFHVFRFFNFILS